MSVDFDFSNMDFGDRRIKPAYHDVFVDCVNMLIQHKGVPNVQMLSDVNGLYASCIFPKFMPTTTDIQVLYSLRLYGGNVVMVPSEDGKKIQIGIVLSNAFERTDSGATDDEKELKERIERIMRAMEEDGSEHDEECDDNE